jgi:hypothetical protein
MQQFIKEFFTDALYQVLGWQRPRSGRLFLTRHAFLKMREYQLDPETLQDAFRFGTPIEEDRVIRHYRDYSVGLIYKLDETQLLRSNPAETKYLIITCWKGVRRS